MTQEWQLFSAPHRHYRVWKGDKWVWNGDDKQRIVSVTTVLGGDSGLSEWAAAQAVSACGTAARRYLTAEEPLNSSLLSWRALVDLTGEMPDQTRDDAARRGTAAHEYLGWRLGGYLHSGSFPEMSYGHRVATAQFIQDYQPRAISDSHGPRVERAVGCAKLAVAGTYDAQVMMGADALGVEVHRIDLKSSNTIRASHFAQLAAYEMLAQQCGERPSEFLTIVHINTCGDYVLHSIKVGGLEHYQALDLWTANLTIYRQTKSLDKVIKENNVSSE